MDLRAMLRGHDCNFISHPSQAIMAAKNGSIKDIEELAYHFGELSLTWQTSALKMYMSHLQRPVQASVNDKPSDTSVPTEQTRRLAYDSIRCIAFGYFDTFITKDASGNLARVILKNWEGIRYWLRYFDKNLYTTDVQLYPDLSQEERTQRIIVTLGAFMHSLTMIDAILIRAHPDEHFFSTALDLWLKQDPRLTRSFTPEGYSPAMTSAVLQRLLDTIRPGGPKLKRLEKANEHLQYLIAEATIERMRLVWNKHTSTRDTRTYAAVLSKIAAYPSILCKALEMRCASIFTKAFVRLCGQFSNILNANGTGSEFEMEQEHLLGSFMSGLSFVEESLSTPRADLFIRNCLRYGFISVLQQASVLPKSRIPYANAAIEQPIKMVLNDLAKYSVYGSVVRLLLFAWEAANEESARKMGMSSVAGFWGRLEWCVLERGICRILYDRAQRRPVVCDNCNEPVENVFLLKCSGCMTARYCSDVCQKLAWQVKLHNLECPRLARIGSLARGHHFRHRSDARFFSKLVASDVRRLYHTVSQYAEKTHRNTPLSKIGFRIDYSDDPRRLTVSTFLLSEDPGFDHRFVAYVSATNESRAKSGNSKRLVVVNAIRPSTSKEHNGYYFVEIDPASNRSANFNSPQTSKGSALKWHSFRINVWLGRKGKAEDPLMESGVDYIDDVLAHYEDVARRPPKQGMTFREKVELSVDRAARQWRARDMDPLQDWE